MLNFILDMFIYAKREGTAKDPDYVLLKAANQNSNLNWQVNCRLEHPFQPWDEPGNSPKNTEKLNYFVLMHFAENGMGDLSHYSDGNSYLLVHQTVSWVCMLKSSSYIYRCAINKNNVYIANTAVVLYFKETRSYGTKKVAKI